MISTVITLGVLSVVLAGGWIWLLALGRAARAEASRLRDENVELRRQQDSLIEQRLKLTRELERETASREEAQRQFDLLQKQSRDAFEALAGKALDQAGDRFLKLATEKIAGAEETAAAHARRREASIKQIVEPMQAAIKEYRLGVEAMEKARSQAFGSLQEQLRQLAVDQLALRTETGNLVKALRRPEVRGRWGEMQLKRVAELAGMIEHCDFTEQAATETSGDGARLRPDMVVHLPTGRSIVVDAKTPIAAFIDATEADDDQARQAHLQRHLQHLETQVRSLSGKAYQQQFTRTPDFVVMFIPGESFLHAAAALRPDLLEWAMGQQVIIASPTTLVALLKAAAMGWREQQVADHAQRISKLGREVHERFAVAAEHLDKLHRSLASTVKHYNRFVGSFDARVLPAARRLAELGADSGRALPDAGETLPIDAQPRSLHVGDETTSADESAVDTDD